VPKLSCDLATDDATIILAKKNHSYKNTIVLLNECAITCDFSIRVPKGVKVTCVSDKMSAGDGMYSVCSRETVGFTLETNNSACVGLEMIVIFRNGSEQRFKIKTDE
jgi:hypothetical protein